VLITPSSPFLLTLKYATLNGHITLNFVKFTICLFTYVDSATMSMVDVHGEGKDNNYAFTIGITALEGHMYTIT